MRKIDDRSLGFEGLNYTIGRVKINKCVSRDVSDEQIQDYIASKGIYLTDGERFILDEIYNRLFGEDNEKD